MLDIKKNVLLSGYTTFKIGGPAKEFVSARTKEELMEVFSYAKENNSKCYVLGGGSNVFFDDRGFDGMVVKLEGIRDINLLNENKIASWAGESLGSVIGFAKNNGLCGMENLAGIPGTIGGAVRGNAGAFGISMSDLVCEVNILDVKNLEIRIAIASECNFSYRDSLFKENNQYIVLSVVLQLQKGRSDEMEEKIKAVIQKRNEKQPVGWIGSAGSFFENPIVSNKELIEKFEKETGVRSRDSKIPAGWLINQADLKGKRIGGIEISEKHANFLINVGNATSQDLIIMSSFIKQQVRDRLGVQLREEVQYVGF
ncbi:MAG: UDP-N-acetylenolpyruvoylglucosamine reductase [uncultured bacterium]|nr:MAG: UDP-N-acetylenolpyruvoylglucosamine reductase [uncultured bacterium]HCU70591.1 UDP-N-acetylenolpyruvoylglucosamine reductase [Candidatus Moranbacteria bacterium]